MAVTHPSSMRSLIADTVVDTADIGSTNPEIVLQASGSTTLVILTMDSTAFGAAAAGVATANPITDGICSTAGTATQGIIRTSTEQNTVCSFSVTSTSGGGDLLLTSNVLSSGQTVSITSLTYTAPS